MAGVQHSSALRRKLAPRRDAAVEAVSGLPGMTLSRTLSRAISDNLPLLIQDSALSRGNGALLECLDTLEPDDFVGLFRGAGDGFGLIALDQPGFAALIEAVTIGRLGARPPVPRRATATDAALVASVIDAAFAALDDDDGLREARFDRHVPDQRLLPILLDDGGYQRLTLQMTLVSGPVQRVLTLRLFLLAKDRRGTRGKRRPVHDDGAATGDHRDAPDAESDRWSAQISERVMAAPAALNAELGRLRRPLSAVLTLKVGDCLDLPLSALEEVLMVDLDGQRVATGRLGQSRGMRAIRVTTWPDGPPVQPPHDSIAVTSSSRLAEGAALQLDDDDVPRFDVTPD